MRYTALDGLDARAARLREVFDRHGTDKGRKHCYELVYAQVPEPRSVLEIGVLRGASLRAWREWWPGAQLVGADLLLRPGLPTDVTVVQADTTLGTLDGPLSSYDVIIDDGSHSHADQAATLEHHVGLLATGGLYFIEDVWWWDDRTRASKWVREHSAQLNERDFGRLLDAIGDREIVTHDLRDCSGNADSFILEVRA